MITAKAHRIADWSVIAVFVALIFLPATRATLDGFERTNRDEFRAPAPWPSIASPAGFPRGFEAFFEDHLGFRAELIGLHSWIKTRWLHTQPHPQVLIGTDGWLYFNGGVDMAPADRVVHQARGVRRLSPDELDAHRETFSQRYDALARFGIPYLLVVAPNKHTIYPEHLPPEMNRVSSTTPLDQVYGMLEERTAVSALDLRPVLRAAKREHPVYYRTDSHWNTIGAHAAYVEMMRALRRWLPTARARPLSDYTLSWDEQEGSSLAAMIALRSGYREDTPTLEPRGGHRSRRLSDEEVQAAYFDEKPKLQEWFETQGLIFVVYEVEDDTLPTALFLVDSFGAALREFVSEHFRTTVFLHRRTQPGVVMRIAKELRPDVVVEELVERALVAQ